ncbi:MAG: CdaR family protein [Candidatus Faecousia sp.]|nr:CdaR family protein [Candidatus Faecousia sp.]
MRRNKLYSMLLSLVVAFALWLYVTNNVSIEDNNTFYNIPVVMESETVLNERNLMVTSVSTNSVSLNLSGARSDLNKLDSSKMSAKVDLSQVTEPGEKIPLSYTISFPSDVSASSFTVGNKNPGAIFVNVDYRRVSEIPVVIKWTGNRSEDYIYDTENAVLDSNTVTISGPAAVVDTIDHAQVEVDLTEQVESISQSYRYTLCDAQDNPVDAEQITTNLEEVRLEMQIQRIREIRLTADVIYGGGANESNTTVSISPETIRVSGGEAVLNELGDTFTVCSVNLADLDKSSTEQKYTITLPEGVTNQTGVNEVTVSIRMTGLKTREFNIDKFEAVNVPEGLSAEIINANLSIKVRGPEAEIAALQEENIRAVVDFTNAEVGTATYKVKIVFDDAFPNVGAIKVSSVSATVQAAGG